MSEIQQLDEQWVRRYHDLGYDLYWWWTWAGPFTQAEKQNWERLDGSVGQKEQQRALLKTSRERALVVAWSENHDPQFWYPTIRREQLARLLEMMRQLKEDIQAGEAHPLVRYLYLETLEWEENRLHMVEASAMQDPERFKQHAYWRTAPPTKAEMLTALAYVVLVLQRAFSKPGTEALARHAWETLQLAVSFSLEEVPDEEKEAVYLSFERKKSLLRLPEFEPPVLQRFFTSIFVDLGLTGWGVEIDSDAPNAWVSETSLLLRNQPESLSRVRHLLVHELGHQFRRDAGRRSLLGLLGEGTRNYEITEEGLLLYLEKRLLEQQEQRFDDAGHRLITLATSLACGTFGTPMGFTALWKLLTCFSCLPRLLRYPEDDRDEVEKKAQSYALQLCLRIFRGVPCLEQHGVCNTKEVIYLRGLRLIEQAVDGDTTLLPRLGVGKVGIEDLEIVEQLGVRASFSLDRLFALATDSRLEEMIRQS